ncbi:MAG: peptide deformylase [Defluviitaleaceae bacterium]|nr:peptide deformylase [Defluviitaleaceae bacterium]MCL2835681.1 peptide deformylase [Defluviitaleaceae bacterium]
MAIRNLRLYGDNLLRKKSKPVEEIDGKLLSLLDDMRDTLKKHNGMGLAAPQVGVLKRVAIIDIELNEDDEPDPELQYGFYELINPVILEEDGEEEQSEACLSMPGKNAPVKRPVRVLVKAQNRDGNEYELEGMGVLARALCHELDHLDGVMYVDLIEPGTLRDNKDTDDE